MQHLPRDLVRASLVVVLTPVASGQDLFYQVDGEHQQDELGECVSRAGDVNGDGFADIIIGASRHDGFFGDNSGRALVVAGRTGAVLYDLEGGAPGIYFGDGVGGAGDVNDDGFDDVIVGAWGDDTAGLNAGSATVFSGANGDVLHQLYGTDPSDHFGVTVAGVGDVDQDGHDDFGVGASWASTFGYRSGRVEIFSGDTGLVLYTFEGTDDNDLVGLTLAPVGFVDADDHPDFVYGVWGASPPVARVISGATGNELLSIDSIGLISLAGAGDVNRDGVDDIILGESRWAHVHSGANGDVLYSHEGEWTLSGGSGQFGAGGGDIDGDGWDDYAIGSTWIDFYVSQASNFVRIYSGFDGSLLYEMEGDDDYDQFGSSVDIVGDTNGDGLDDILIGAPNDSSTKGRARLYGFPFDTRIVCDGEPNSAGNVGATLELVGSVTVTDNNVTLRSTELPPHKPLYFLASRIVGEFTPAGSTGTLCLGAPIGRFNGPGQVLNSGSNGIAQLQIDLTAHASSTGLITVHAGETWHYQGWYRDEVLNIPTSNFSDGIGVNYK